VRQGVRNCIINPAYGKYCCAENSEGKVVGGLLITFEMSPRLGGMIYWIQSVYVLPEYRGQKVFRALYEFVVAQSNADPIAKCVRLYVDADNVKA
jgi:ribosomal protein S18 acetylase RimI-like enzyme